VASATTTITRSLRPRALRLWGEAPRHVAEHGVQCGGHDRHVGSERQREADVFSEHELFAADRLGHEAVDAAPLDLLRDQADADEHRDEQPEQGDGGQAEVLDDLDVLPCRELAQQIRRTDQQNREQHEVVEHFIADRFAEDVGRDGRGRFHEGSARVVPSPGAWPGRRGWSPADEEIFEVCGIGFNDTRCAPRIVNSPSSSGAGSSGRSSR
jgi:hypothetical protein